MKVLIIDKVHEVLPQGLRQLGYEVEYQPDISMEEIFQKMGDYDGVVVRSKIYIDNNFLDKAPRLKWIARAGAGMDNVDERVATERGIQCVHAGGANANAVGEHAIGMLLSLLHKINQGDAQLRKYIFNRQANEGYELRGQKVGIIGYGHTGKSFASKLSGFGVEVLAYDKYINVEGNHYIKSSSLDEIFEQADIISFHVPLTDETYHYLNDAWLSSFHKNIIVINASRGQVVDTASLVKNIELGKVLGCCLDVFENEKLEALEAGQKKNFEYLISHPRTVLTPHVAGWSEQSFEAISELLLQKIKHLA